MDSLKRSFIRCNYFMLDEKHIALSDVIVLCKPFDHILFVGERNLQENRFGSPAFKVYFVVEKIFFSCRLGSKLLGQISLSVPSLSGKHHSTLLF